VTTPEQAYGGGARPFAATATSDRTDTAAPASSSARTAPRTAAAGPRRVRLTVARIDPWSAMKLSFLLSVAIGIALVVTVGVLWTILDSMGVFSSVNSTIGEVLGDSNTTFNLMDYIGFSRVLSLATVIAVVDVFLLTALLTLSAFLYNVCSSLVGGLHLTLTDD
jgi:hypothetical protein